MRGVTRQRFRFLLAAMLAATAAIAVWTWIRPYAWNPDPEARAKIVAVTLQKDHSYHWLDIRLKIRPDMEHDLRKPVFLKTRAHPRLEPADTTLSGKTDRPVDELFLRFWLEEGDLDGPIHLHLNDGILNVRAGSGAPRMKRDGRANFQSRNW